MPGALQKKLFRLTCRLKQFPVIQQAISDMGKEPSNICPGFPGPKINKMMSWLWKKCWAGCRDYSKKEEGSSCWLSTPWEQDRQKFFKTGLIDQRVEENRFESNRNTNPLRVITKKPISASDAELKKNPRARSAKLRIAEKA